MERRIPGSVWIAAGGLGVVTAVQAALALLLAQGGHVGWGQFLFAAVLAVALLAGLVRGSRLAWMWGRWLSLLLGALVLARAAVAVARSETTPGLTAAVVLGMALPLLAAGVVLGRRSALAFYGLVCPLCGSPTRLAADLLFRRARCKPCGNVW